MTNIKQFPGKKVDASLPEAIQNTEAYSMNEIMYCPVQTKTVPDFESGSQRNRRWGMTMGLAIIPHFDEMTPNQGPILLPKSPTRFFAADTLEELKQRVIHEIDRAIELADMSVNDPDKFMEFQKQEMAKAAQSYAPRDPEDDMN